MYSSFILVRVFYDIVLTQADTFPCCKKAGVMRVPAPPGLWLCVGELALWCPAFAPHLWSCSAVSPTLAGPHHAGSPRSHIDCETAPSPPAVSTHKHTQAQTKNVNKKIGKKRSVWTFKLWRGFSSFGFFITVMFSRSEANSWPRSKHVWGPFLTWR